MARSPFWLAAPSRFATIGKARARVILVLVALLLLGATLLALRVPDPEAVGGAPASAVTTADGPQQTDLMLYEKVVTAMRGGADYYTAATDAMRAGRYPLRPFVAVRLPALASIQAALPIWGPPALLFLLAAAVGIAWGNRLGEALPRALPRIAALILLLGSMLAFLQAGLWAFHEIWAGLLVALSLALRRPGRWAEAVAIALAAMLIRETAALYAVLMLVLALAERQRREALGWAVALGLFAAALGAHAWAVAGATNALDPASPGWTGLLGFGFFVKAIALATALQLLPMALAALLVGLSLFGWASWRDPLALRMFVTLAGYAAVIGLFARSDNFYWALIIAPVFLVGLAFVPDGLRDLFRAAAALDKRRITVTRVTR